MKNIPFASVPRAASQRSSTVSPKNSSWAPAVCIMCDLALTQIDRCDDEFHVLYLFFLILSFNDLCRQREARRVFNTFVYLAKTTPKREEQRRMCFLLKQSATPSVVSTQMQIRRQEQWFISPQITNLPQSMGASGKCHV